jgi:hypothetical protein
MPRLRPAALHLPELRLPMMSRAEIDAKNAQRSDTRLTRWDPRRLDLSEIELPRMDLSRLELPRIDLPAIDLPQALTAAAQATGLVARRRSRTPWIVGGGLIALATIGIAVAMSPPVRPRLAALAGRARQRLDERRGLRRDESIDAKAMPTIDDPGVGGEVGSIDGPRPAADQADTDGSVAIPIEPDAFRADVEDAVDAIEAPAEDVAAAG